MYRHLLIIIFPLCVLVGLWGISYRIVHAGQLNWANIVIDGSWLILKDIPIRDKRLQDEIPDNWSVSNWGNARAIFSIDHEQVYKGKNSAYIKKNNVQDGSVFEQIFGAKPDVEVECTVFHRGVDAFLQILGERINTVTKLRRTDSWKRTVVYFQMPSNEQNVRLFLGLFGTQGIAWFDEVDCRSVTNRNQPLLTNGDFEADGIEMNPLQWWIKMREDSVIPTKKLEQAYQIILNLADVSTTSISRMNAVDLLLGRNERVVERMAYVSDGCIYNDGNPALLLELGYSFQNKSLAAYEQIMEFAIMLMPKCPQPYASLAELYQSVHAFTRATQLYHEAEKHGLPGMQQGNYLFSEGMMHVTQTGDWARAIEVLTAAEEQTGWERGEWYHGAAAIYLGEALTRAGQCREAKAAYQKVLDCALCSARYTEAHAALQNLGNCMSNTQPGS